MPTVEKTSGGRVYIRPLDQRFGIGDRVDVDEEMAAYLCDERGDFSRIVEKDDAEDESEDTEDESESEDVDEELPFDPADLTVDELEERIADIDDAETLDAIGQAEDEGKSRETAFEAINDRLDDLEG